MGITSEKNYGGVRVFFGEKNGKYPDGNQVVVTGTEGKAVFDTPLSSLEMETELAGADMVLLGHVHEDHTCGLSMFPEAEVWAHTEDVKAVRSYEGLRDHYGYLGEAWENMQDLVVEQFNFTPRPDAKAYEDGMEWDLGGIKVSAFHLPGHTAGHCALVADGVAFIGDIDLSTFGPYYGDATSNLEAFEASLKKVAEIDAKVWVTSHHKGAIEDRSEFLTLLTAYGERIEQRDQALLSSLAEPKTLPELVAQRFLYPVEYNQPYVDDVERNTITDHLKRLLARGQVTEENGAFRKV